MQQLKTTDNGGFPIVLDDLRWIQDGINLGFKGALSAAGIGLDTEQGAVLSGCVESGADITSGYIVLNGEVMFYPGDLAILPIAGGSEAYFELDPAVDAAGLKTFQDTVTHDTYQIRNARIVVSASPPANRLTWGDDTGRTILTWEENLNGIDDAWHQPDAAGEPALVGSWVQSTGSVPRLQFKKDKHGIIRLRGAIKDGSVVVNTLDATFVLPVGYRPSNNATGAITAALQSSVYGTVFVQIDSAGQVNVIGLPSSLAGAFTGGSDFISFDLTFSTIA